MGRPGSRGQARHVILLAENVISHLGCFLMLQFSKVNNEYNLRDNPCCPNRLASLPSIFILGDIILNAFMSDPNLLVLV